MAEAEDAARARKKAACFIMVVIVGGVGVLFCVDVRGWSERFFLDLAFIRD